MVESAPNSPNFADLRFYIYRRPLHPELFSVFLRQTVATRRYDAEISVLGLGHRIAFHSGGAALTEIASVESPFYSNRSLVEKIVLGDRTEIDFTTNDDLHYALSIQVEHLSEPVFERVYDEMVDYGRRRGLFMMFDQWRRDTLAPPFTLLDYVHRPWEFCVSSWHVFPAERVLLKSQSVFSIHAIEGLDPADAETQRSDDDLS
jgi:hypothetical protein